MRIRIKSTGEKSANSWYAAFVGEEFEVIESDSPHHFIVGVRHLPHLFLIDHFAFVQKSDAEVIKLRYLKGEDGKYHICEKAEDSDA